MSLGAWGTQDANIRPTSEKTKGQKAMARVSEAKEKTEVGTYLHCHCLKYVFLVVI